MEITLEMLDNDTITTLLVMGDFCNIDISDLIKVSPTFDTYEIITTFIVVQHEPHQTFRYQSLIDALQKFNEIEELA